MNRLLALSVALSSFAAIAADLSATSPTVGRGGTASVPITLNPGVDSVSTLQWDVEYDPAVLDVSFLPAASSRRAAKVIRVAKLGPGRKRLLLFGMNSNSIPQGAIVTMLVLIRPDAAAGVSPLRLTNLAASSGAGDAVSITPLAISVVVTDTKATGAISRDQVLNAASLRPSPIVGDEMITLLGPGIGPSLEERGSGAADSRIQFDGVSATLVYAAPNIVTTVVPASTLGPSTVLSLGFTGGQTFTTSLEVMPAAVGVFTADRKGVGQAIALNADGSRNSAANPVRAGDTIEVFLTGVGKEPLTARLAGIDAAVTGYQLTAPGVVSARVVVPESAPSMPNARLVFKAGDSLSQPAVTIAVQ